MVRHPSILESPARSRHRRSAVSAHAIANRIGRLIVLRDGSSTAAARRLGLDPSALAAALSGRWDDLTLDLLAAVVTGYQVDVAWLVGGRTSSRASQPRSEALHRSRSR